MFRILIYNVLFLFFSAQAIAGGPGAEGFTPPEALDLCKLEAVMKGLHSADEATKKKAASELFALIDSLNSAGQTDHGRNLREELLTSQRFFSELLGALVDSNAEVRRAALATVRVLTRNQDEIALETRRALLGLDIVPMLTNILKLAVEEGCEQSVCNILYLIRQLLDSADPETLTRFRTGIYTSDGLETLLIEAARLNGESIHAHLYSFLEFLLRKEGVQTEQHRADFLQAGFHFAVFQGLPAFTGIPFEILEEGIPGVQRVRTQIARILGLMHPAVLEALEDESSRLDQLALLRVLELMTNYESQFDFDAGEELTALLCRDHERLYSLLAALWRRNLSSPNEEFNVIFSRFIYYLSQAGFFDEHAEQNQRLILLPGLLPLLAQQLLRGGTEQGIFPLYVLTELVLSQDPLVVQNMNLWRVEGLLRGLRFHLNRSRLVDRLTVLRLLYVLVPRGEHGPALAARETIVRSGVLLPVMRLTGIPRERLCEDSDMLLRLFGQAVVPQALDFYFEVANAAVGQELPAGPEAPVELARLNAFLTDMGIDVQRVFAERNGFWTWMTHRSETVFTRLGLFRLPRQGLDRVLSYLGTMRRVGFVAANVDRRPGEQWQVVRALNLPALPPEVVLMVLNMLRRIEIFDFRGGRAPSK